MSVLNTRYTRLEDGQAAPVANSQMPVAAPRNGLPGLLTTIGVFASLGGFFSLLALILNVASASILGNSPFIHYYYDNDGVVNFVTTPGIWFGIPNGVLCVVTLASSVQMRRRDFSTCLQVTGILVSVFHGIMTPFAVAACAIAATRTNYSSAYDSDLPGLFTGVSVFSGLAILVNLILCVLMAVVVCMASGCCRPSDGYIAYVYPPTTQAATIHQTQTAPTPLFSAKMAAPFPQTAGTTPVTSMPPNRPPLDCLSFAQEHVSVLVVFKH